MQNILAAQYEFIKNSRNILLEYCASMKPEHLMQEIENFGRGSIRNLLVHNANCYEYWLGEISLTKKITYPEYETVKDIRQIREYYERVNSRVVEFLETFRGRYDTEIEGHTGTRNITASPFKLFTHVITHEFHHKGQMLSMGRHLGYIPPDTDIVR